MKRLGILFYIFALLLLGVRCEAQSQYTGVLTKMETSLFGINYGTQSDEIRLKRIEENVYGSTSSNPIPQRINKLSKDLSVDLIGQEIKPKKDTFAEDDDNYKEAIPKADSNINYPVVDGLERSVFNKEFKSTDINQRLSNLEQNVFKKTYNDDLSSRVDRLKQAVMPQKIVNKADSDDEDDSLMNQTSQFQDNGYDKYNNQNNRLGGLLGQGPTGFGSNIPQFPNYNSNNSVFDDYQSSSDVDIPLAQLEKKVLKRSFPNDTPSNRLSRLELKIFNSTFTDDDEQTRIDRISSAYQAQKTSKKYDSNKFAQHAATAMQVGAILLMILAAVI